MSKYLIRTVDVCYLRLDFESFTIVGPSTSLETNGGACQDTFKVNVSEKIIVTIYISEFGGQLLKTIMFKNKWHISYHVLSLFIKKKHALAL